MDIRAYIFYPQNDLSFDLSQKISRTYTLVMPLFEKYTDLVPRNICPVELTDFLLNKALCIPNRKIQHKILRALIMLPSSLSSRCPFVQSYGLSGTGKSSFLKIVASVHGYNLSTIVSDNATATSIRNQTQSLKYGEGWYQAIKDGEDLIEQNICRLIDDISYEQLIRSSALISIFKCSYDRSTSTITIAIPGSGENLSFDTFAGVNFVSSCTLLCSLPELYELKRRSLIVVHKRYESFNDEDKKLNLSPQHEDFIELDEYDFSGYQGFANYWLNNNIHFNHISKHGKKTIKRILKESTLNSHQSSLLYDTIITHLVLEQCHLDDEKLENESHEFVAILEDYFSQLDEMLINDQSALQLFLHTFLEHQIKLHGNNNYPLEIESKTLKDAIQTAYNLGEIQESCNSDKITRIMRSMGWRQTRSITSSKRIVWTQFI